MSFSRYFVWWVFVSSLLAADSTSVPPAADFAPMPQKVREEVESFYSSLDRDLLNRDLNAVMRHYTAGIESNFHVYYPGIDQHFTTHRSTSEFKWNLQIQLTAMEADRIQELRKEFEYRPGPSASSFTLRYKSYVRGDSGEFSTDPFAEVTAIFKRTDDRLQISDLSTERLLPSKIYRAPSLVQPLPLDRSIGAPLLASFSSGSLLTRFSRETTKAEIVEVLGPPQQTMVLKHAEVLIYYLYRFSDEAGNGEGITAEILLTEDGKFDGMTSGSSALTPSVR